MESRAAAHEAYERRRPHRTHHHRSRHPEPPAVHECPTSIVEGRESPGLIFHPGPAPRPNIGPVSEAVRSPAYDDRARTPARAITRHIAPVAVFVEIFISGHLARNIVGRVGAIFTVVALKRPVVEIIRPGNLAEIVIQIDRKSTRLNSSHMSI